MKTVSEVDYVAYVKSLPDSLLKPLHTRLNNAYWKAADDNTEAKLNELELKIRCVDHELEKRGWIYNGHQWQKV